MKKTIIISTIATIATLAFCMVAKSQTVNTDSYMNHLKCVYSRNCHYKEESLKRAHELIIQQYKNDLLWARKQICMSANGNFSNWNEYCNL